MSQELDERAVEAAASNLMRIAARLGAVRFIPVPSPGGTPEGEQG